jgi:hypothetical protein
MPTTYPGFDPFPPHNGTQTSVDAAAYVAPSTASQRERIVVFIRQQGGATCAEIEDGLQMLHQTASARLNELFHKEHRIADSGLRRPRRSNKRGPGGVVWIIAPPTVLAP